MFALWKSGSTKAVNYARLLSFLSIVLPVLGCAASVVLNDDLIGRAADRPGELFQKPLDPGPSRLQVTDGPTLDETLEFLARLIGEGKAREDGQSGYTDWNEYTQGSALAGPPCVFSWDETQRFHYMEGTPPVARDGKRFSQDKARRWVSLKDILISELKALDLRSWVQDEKYNDGSFFFSTHRTYSGYVLVVKQSYHIFSVPHDSIPDPSKLGVGQLPVERIFFVSESDAQRSLQAMKHAAALCGAKTDPF
jgi:hypothetical protein